MSPSISSTLLGQGMALGAMSEPLQPSSSDHVLIHRFRMGDEDAALQLYYRYADRLMRLLHKTRLQS